MLRRHPFDRGARWVTLLALLLATLAPSVAHALRHVRGEVMPWSQLCSATGGKRIVFEPPTNGGSPLQQAHAFDHCTYCALHHDAPVPGGATVSFGLRAELTLAEPAGGLEQPRQPPRWHAAPARGPPVS